jgi:MFS family permease
MPESTRVEERNEEIGGRLAEFAVGWPVLLGAAIGIGVGIIALPSPAVGVFMRDLQTEFGWSRAQISLGPTILILTLAAISPFLGWIADRVPPRLIVGVSLAALATGLYLFSGLNGDLRHYYFGFGALAVGASGSATIVYAKVLSAVFHRNRGFALGLAMIGNGATGVLLPLLLAPYAATQGWRAGFVALAVLVAVALPAVVLLIGSGRTRPMADSRTAAPDGGLGDALSSRSFWIMILCFTLIPFAVSGLHLHFFAYLSDMGLDPARAGVIASVGGAALVVARVLTGFLIDHIFAPYVAAVMMGLSALAIAGMGLWGAGAAVLGAIAIGLSLGAELDLIGYMTARYFGLVRFGRIYGIMYAAVLVGGAASPIAYGMIADRSGSYQAGLYAAAALLTASALLFLALPRFPAAAEH